ncbi:beta strand repeat-containing protein [Clostridium frigoriphilum]|uniref:Ig-like domain-containing protein n=1 Tax=Clostridium frigoriphilum TaxID=443253 RepID=A0ABU7UMD3_9CLOT
MKSNTYKKIAMASFALAIAAGSTSLAHAATGDIINTTNKKIYAVSSSETIKALIADLKDAGGDVFLIEDASGKYFDSNAKLTAQSAEVAKYLLAGNVSLTDPTAIKTYVTANAASITAAVKVATDKVATSTVDITTYTPPVIVTTDAEKAAAVDTTIAALPAVADLKLTDSAAVTAAKTAYTALTDTQKALVTKLDTLTAVEAQIKVLTEAAALPVVSSVSAINATAATGDSYTLPTTVKATLSDGTTKDIAVTWDKVASATVAGSFTFTGTLAATSGVVNTNNVTVSATLTVTSAIKSELAKVTNAVVTTVPFGTANTQVGVEAAMLVLANHAVDTGYTVSIQADSTYSPTLKVWTGKFIVTNNTNLAVTTDVAARSITVATSASAAGAIAQLALVTPAVVTTVPFGTANTQVAVEAAILKLANAAVDPAYTVTIADGSTYSTASKTWIGKLIVTNNTTAANTTTDAGYRTVVVATGVSTAGSTTELAKITNAVVTTVPSGTLNTKIAVEAAIVNLANAAVDPAYTVTIADGSSYSTTSKLWTGKLTVTNIITGANTTTDATYRTITVATAASAAGSVIELAKVTNAVVTTLPSGTANTQVAVEAAILKLANAAVDQAYTVTIAEGSTYSTASKSWTGKLIVTNNTTAANATTDAYRTITVVNAASTAGATAELAKVTNAAITTVPFGTNTTGAGAQAAVETAITTLAQAKVGSGYTVTIAAGSTYSTVSKVWTGKLIVTNDVTNTNTITDATYRSITVAVAVDVTGATAQLANVTNAVVTTVPSGTANTQADVESAMLALANAAVDPAYVVTIAPGSTYTPASKAWSGEFTVTNIANPEITKTDAAYRVIVVATQAPSTIVFGSGATVAKLATDSAFTNAASGIGAGTITYSSATPATATVNPTTGEVTIFAPGTTVITATRAATTANTAVTATYTVNVSAALIAPSTILVATPAVDGTPATTIAAGTGYTGTISWTTPATGNFVAATPAATVVLTADANHTFTGIAATGAITIAGSTSATYVVSGAGHILTITVGYAAIS